MLTLMHHKISISTSPADNLFMGKLTDGIFKEIHLHHLSPSKITRLSVHANFSSGEQIQEMRQNFAHLYGQSVGKSVPSISFFTPLPDQKPTETDVAILYLPTDASGSTHFKTYTSENYVVHKDGEEVYLFSGSISFFRHEHHSLDHSQRALDFVEQLLDHEDLTLNSIRQMNVFIAHKDASEHLVHHKQTHLQSFEQIKNTYFQLYDWPTKNPDIQIFDAPCGGTSLDLLACTEPCAFHFPFANI